MNKKLIYLLAVSLAFGSSDMKLASNHTTPRETLVSLSKDSDEDVRMAVAANPNTPEEVLIELCKDKEEDVIISAIGNKNTPISVIIPLFNHKDDDIRSAVARHPQLPKETMEILANDKDDGVREALASNINAGDNILTLLSNDKDDDVVKAVAKNPKTPPDLLKRLKENVIKIRFYNGIPKMTRIKCDNFCNKECAEDIDLDSFLIIPHVRTPDSVSISMTPTINSQQALEKKDRFFSEQEIKRDGNFRVMYYAATRNTQNGLWYDIILSVGKEYEIYANFQEAEVYLINSDGTTSRLKTSYPIEKECSWLKKITRLITKEDSTTNENVGVIKK